MTATLTAPFAFGDFENTAAALRRSMEEGDRYVLLTGESGAGKTTLLRTVRDGLDRKLFRVIYFNLARLSPAGLVRVLARNLRVPPSRSQPETVRELVHVLANDAVATWLWVDEGQLLPDETFAELRTLAETELGPRASVSVLLVGLPELRERMLAPRLFPIWRRLEARLAITGLRSDEVEPFVRHHAEAEPQARLTPDGLQVLFERSRGLPGLLALYLRQLRRAPAGGPFDAARVDALLQRWED